MWTLALLLAGQVPSDTSPNSEARLLTAASQVQAGKPFFAALQIKMQPGWHSYWVFPGDSGGPTTIKWDLPKGWKAGPLQWPVPHRLEADGMVSYGYEDEVLLPLEITAPADAKPGQYTLKGVASWMLCKDICLSAKENLTLSVRVASKTQASSQAVAISRTRAKLPKKLTNPKLSASRKDSELSIELPKSGALAGDLDKVAFYPMAESIELMAAQELESVGGARVLRLKMSQFAPPTLSKLHGLLVIRRPGQPQSQAFVIEVPIRNQEEH